MKTTAYFREMRKRPDRAAILDEWITATIDDPVAEEVQDDGRIRRWRRIPEVDNRALRVILLEDGETVHNAFLIERSRRMKAKYFQDTDTLYLELRDSKVAETRDLDQDTILDFDGQGQVVGITLEHAKTRTGGPRIEFETVEAQ